MTPEELELVSTDDLLAAICARYDVAGFVGMKVNATGPNGHSYRRAWTGNSHTVIGLCYDLADKVLRAYGATETMVGEDTDKEDVT